MAFDPQVFKSQFPLFTLEDNQSLVYFDNAATTQKPQCVMDAITHFYTHNNGNAQRASHRLARAATNMLEDTRRLATAFLGANSPREVVFTSGATEGLNLVSHGLGEHLQAGDEILLTHSEHHANILPWQRVAQSCSASLGFLPPESLLNVDHLLSLVTPHTRIIALSGASNVLGNLLDLSLIAAIKERFPQLIVVLDASQLACHVPLQASNWQCDFLVCSAHKIYGPTGIGLLFGREAVLHTLSPWMVGGEMVDKVSSQSSCFTAGVQRFEAGTSALGAIAGLRACLQFWQHQDRSAMQHYEQSLTDYLYQQLASVCDNSDLQLVSSPQQNVGMATLVVSVNAVSSSSSPQSLFSLGDLAHYLDACDIAVRVGDHCAQLLWQSLAETHGSDKGLRISLAAYNTRDDVDRLIKAIQAFLALSDSSDVANVPHEVEDWSDLDELDLLAVTSWQQRYKLLLQWGARLTPKPAIRQEVYVVRGCEANVWLKHTRIDDKHYFAIDSDANTIKGLAALMLVWLNGKTTSEVRKADVYTRYQQLGLQKHLTISRANGFRALLDSALAWCDE